MNDAARWFLTARERGNAATSIDRDKPGDEAWTCGNHLGPSLHGAEYFAALVREVSALGSGDMLWLTDWRGEDDEVLAADGPRLGTLLTDACRRGVQVRGLLWRSHPALFGFSEDQDSDLARKVNDAGGQMLLDERVRRGGSHHQKMVLLLHPGRPREDLAFVGGVDLCHGRRDEAAHAGDPQPPPLGPEYGDRPPWHDLQVEIRGPAVADVAATFRERWNDPTPLERRWSPLRPLTRLRSDERAVPEPLAPVERAPSLPGGRAVQVLRTYPAKRPGYPFAPRGERSIARLYLKVLATARSLIYIEDQYFWSREVARAFMGALDREPDLHLMIVVPRFTERDGALSGPANRVGQVTSLPELTRRFPDRVAVYDIENEAGTPIYVHAKAVVADDFLAVVGSDNMNRRSWTHDSELSVAVIEDGDTVADGFARDLRMRLWREHLGPGADIPEGTKEGFDLWRRSAAELDAWHEAGGTGTRPPGRVRVHRPADVAAWQRWWAGPLYSAMVDPDGRPRNLRREGRF
jgi:phosphatidylserine/phosphatidylglycerophosphate/cardiolipin synthase-like enzyme